jgi:hypothetical protein
MTLLLASCAVTPSAPAAPPEQVMAGDRLAAKLECLQYEPARHAATCKVFHHVFAPDGRLLTKGLGGAYEHHRGLFLGWNKLRCGGKTFDFWHCSKGETQRFVAFEPPAAMGLEHDWQVARIDWQAPDGKTLLHERRAMRACLRADGSTVLDVQVGLRAADAAVVLDGDPQHAGHQFRALQQFAEQDAGVTYVRPATARARADDVWTDCDWSAAVLPLSSGLVTVLRVEGTGNPKPATWATRGYGRFGAMVRCEVTRDVELRLGYTYVIATGEHDADWCAGCAAEAIASKHGG